MNLKNGSVMCTVATGPLRLCAAPKGDPSLGAVLGNAQLYVYVDKNGSPLNVQSSPGPSCKNPLGATPTSG